MTGSLFILIIVVFLSVAAGVVIYALNRHKTKMIQAHLRARDFIERQQVAVWASATIMSLQGGILTSDTAVVSNWARCVLSLEINPPSGEVYIARTTWLVDVTQMSMLQQGQHLSVKIDQEDPTIIYPNVGWAKYLSGG